MQLFAAAATEVKKSCPAHSLLALLFPLSSSFHPHQFSLTHSNAIVLQATSCLHVFFMVFNHAHFISWLHLCQLICTTLASLREVSHLDDWGKLLRLHALHSPRSAVLCCHCKFANFVEYQLWEFGTAMSCGVACRHVVDPVLPWWHRPAAVTPIQPLA